MSDPAQRVFQFRLPMRIQSSKKKKTALNLNIYRNLHHRSAHAQKVNFHKLASKMLQGMPQLGRITLHYDVCPQTKRRLDVMNVGSIVDKYFSDCLTEEGIIEDDDYTRISFVSFGFGGLVKDEHVLVTITEIEPREENAVRILLDNQDVQNALDAYVMNDLGLTGATGVRLYMENDEVVAEVLMGDTTPKPKPPVKRRAAAKKTTIVKESAPDVDTTVPDSPAGDGGGGPETGSEEVNETTDSDKTPEKKTSPKKAGKPAKNLFGGSPDESSKVTDSEAKTEDGAADKSEADVKPAGKKQNSIFAI